MNLKISVSQISTGAQGDDVSRIQKTLRALGKDIPATEPKNCNMRHGTVVVAKAFQTQAGLPTTGGVDGATAKMFDAKLAGLAVALRVAVLDHTDKSVETSPSGASILSKIAILIGFQGEKSWLSFNTM